VRLSWLNESQQKKLWTFPSPSSLLFELFERFEPLNGLNPGDFLAPKKSLGVLAQHRCLLRAHNVGQR
jgi:hypothetical protein